MGRWTRGRLPTVVGLVLVGGVGGGTIWAFRLAPAQRGDALALLGIGLGLVVLLPLLVRPERRRRSADSRPVEVLATLLTQAVYGQWRTAADERRLVTPAPIPIHWSLSDLDVAGPVAAAVGAPDGSPAFPPLPGHITITEEELRAGGGRRELHQLFAGLASGRIVVVGAPGAGKSGAAILLVLDAVAHRDSLDDTQRARVPVPVLFTGHGWDPKTTSVQDWLRDRLVATYPLFQRSGGDADAAALVAAQDKIALILDGLDEMDETLRPAALQALSDAPFRVVCWRGGCPPRSPLTLIRDTCQANDNADELLDATRYRSTEAIQQHLIARVLPAAYTPRPVRPSPRYSEQQARQALTFIARKMGKERDLAWWRIPSWAPVTPRILATGLVAGLMTGLVGELEAGLGIWAGLRLGLVTGLVVALTYPEIWPTTLAWRQLRRCGHVPAVSLMPFLEDARGQGVLRTVGGVYQFRHATLQDQLADQTTPASAVSRVS
ncbi:MAG: hypothetical protein ACRDTD_00880 [Pseudonocardiaceae bacterium]